jgi:hypothetical protein
VDETGEVEEVGPLGAGDEPPYGIWVAQIAPHDLDPVRRVPGSIGMDEAAHPPVARAWALVGPVRVLLGGEEMDEAVPDPAGRPGDECERPFGDGESLPRAPAAPVDSPPMLASADRFLAAFTGDLLELELGPLPEEERKETVAWVRTRVRGAASVTRLGLTVAGLAVATTVAVLARAPYTRLPEERRRAVARRLAATRLPVAGEYVKAVRSLAILHAAEHAA